MVTPLTTTEYLSTLGTSPFHKYSPLYILSHISAVVGGRTRVMAVIRLGGADGAAKAL